MPIVKRSASKRKRPAALLQRSNPKKTKPVGAKPQSAKPPAAYFDADHFAEDASAPLHGKLRAIHVALDDDWLTTDHQLDLYYAHADKIRDVLAEGFYAINAAALKSEAKALKLAAALEQRADDLLADYAAEAKRVPNKLELHQLNIDQYPELAGEDFAVIGGWVFSSVELREPRRPGPRFTFNSFFRRR